MLTSAKLSSQRQWNRPQQQQQPGRNTKQEDKPMKQNAFEINRLYQDNYTAFIVVKRSADFVSFKNVATNEITRKKVSTTYIRGEAYEIANLKNISGKRIRLLASPIMQEYVNDVIAQAKEDYEYLLSPTIKQPETQASTPETTPAATEQPEQQKQPEPSRDILEAHCKAAYDCTNTEDMRSLLDILSADILVGMCKLVNATNSSSLTKEEYIDAFISAAMEHKAMKAAIEAQASASTPAPVEVNPETQ